MKILFSKTFRSGNSEAVRLPTEVAFGEGVEVEIITPGDSLPIRRKSQHSGQDLIEALSRLPKPDHIQKREPIEFPKRPGL